VPCADTLYGRFGRACAFELVNVQITVRETRRVLTVLTDAQGAFATTFQPLPGEAGRYGIGAAHRVLSRFRPGHIHPCRFRFDPPELAIELAGAESRTGRVALVNLTEIPLAQLSVTSSPLPAGLEIEWTLPSALPPDGEADRRLSRHIDTRTRAASPLWADVQSAEGAWNRLPISMIVQPLEPRLVKRCPARSSPAWSG
jgi:hypothetical protein